LSLHLVKTMVERNGGSIELESSLGVGSTIEVHLKSYN
jgi:signal transduction histidine kinase